ncbi:MAG TPA: ABC transporter ATP-binding protein [Caulobacteraceae bacterium]|jgi:iron(III) transport system ATP-binding protein|nr:ABC transporter ATP-binding protein [Caulobacteraceae bacterium]
MVSPLFREVGTQGVIEAAAFTVRGLTKRFGEAVAVDNVDLTAPVGQFTCLVGPSGCGKTTLLRLLMGLEQPSAGVIELGGVDVTRAAPAKRGMGMVFQSYALFPNMRVSANVAFGMPRALASQEKAKRTAALLETVGLPGLERRYPGQLSGGQQQRVAIARALAVEPRILLLDEPLAALDPQIREQLRLELKALQRRLGVTTVMVTHDQAEALAVADLIVVMRAGRIEQIGSPQSVYDAPANPFVASFLGAANLLGGEVASPGEVSLHGGQTLPVDAKAFTLGQTVVVTVRPEAVRVIGPEQPGLTGKVTGQVFGGAASRVEVQLDGPGAKTLMVDVAAGNPCPGPGEAVRLGLPIPSLRLFPKLAEGTA